MDFISFYFLCLFENCEPFVFFKLDWHAKIRKSFSLSNYPFLMKEKLSILDFIDNGIGDVEPVKPPEIEATPFKLVEEVKDLKELAAKLRGVNEFAVNFDCNDIIN